jgi:hypothetical protein
MYLLTLRGIFHFISWQLPRKEWRKSKAGNAFWRYLVGISNATSITVGLLVILVSSSRTISGLYLDEVKAPSFYTLYTSLFKYIVPLHTIKPVIRKELLNKEHGSFHVK